MSLADLTIAQIAGPLRRRCLGACERCDAAAIATAFVVLLVVGAGASDPSIAKSDYCGVAQ